MTPKEQLQLARDLAADIYIRDCMKGRAAEFFTIQNTEALCDLMRTGQLDRDVRVQAALHAIREMTDATA